MFYPLQVAGYTSGLEPHQAFFDERFTVIMTEAELLECEPFIFSFLSQLRASCAEVRRCKNCLLVVIVLIIVLIM